MKFSANPNSFNKQNIPYIPIKKIKIHTLSFLSTFKKVIDVSKSEVGLGMPISKKKTSNFTVENLYFTFH